MRQHWPKKFAPDVKGHSHDLFCQIYPNLSARWGNPHMKVVGMLVVSLRGLNFGFWSHLGCSGQNAIIFSHEGLV